MEIRNSIKSGEVKELISSSKCDICSKVFVDRYLRDFHMINLHCPGMYYTCYKCVSNTDVDETEIYFKSLYNLYMHKYEFHDEKGYNFQHYLDM